MQANAPFPRSMSPVCPQIVTLLFGRALGTKAIPRIWRIDHQAHYRYDYTYMKANRLFWQKSKIQNRFVVELSIDEVGDPVRYPSGIKYGLICIDLQTGKKVLIDNHHPKGHHLHIDDRELNYDFVDVKTLMKDFKRIVREHLEVKL